MKKIEVRVLNPEAITDAEKMLVAMARLTQRAHKITCMSDLLDLIDKPYTTETVRSMSALPHPTIQKFGLVNIAVVGASRRFLAQITRHQNEIKFMSGSLQYSDYSGAAQFTVPYELTRLDAEQPMYECSHWYEQQYINTAQQAFSDYEAAIRNGVDNDSAGYMMPQGLRNVLVISALPFELKHIISQRICNRNTLETQFVSLRIWEELCTLSPMFDNCGPSCIEQNKCTEGKMSCKHFLHDVEVDNYMHEHKCSLPTAILDTKFKYIRGGDNHV